MKNKIAIRLKNNGNNYLSFEEVTEIIPETNCVTINDKNYKKLINICYIIIPTSSYVKKNRSTKIDNKFLNIFE